MISPMFSAIIKCKRIAPATATGRSRVHTTNGKPISTTSVKTTPSPMYASHSQRFSGWQSQTRKS